MPLGFTFCSIVVKKNSLENILAMGCPDEESKNVIENLLCSPFQDDFLVAIETMSFDLEHEKSILNHLGLTWHDGQASVDYFIPSEGPYIAEWLSFSRIKSAEANTGTRKPYYQVFRHIDDFSTDIVTFDDRLSNTKFPIRGQVLNRLNCVKTAKYEFGTKLKTPTTEELLELIANKNIVCPMPTQWNDLYSLLSDVSQGSPPTPLILAAWFDEPSDKKSRFKEMLIWACNKNLGDLVSTYIDLMKSDEWLKEETY